MMGLADIAQWFAQQMQPAQTQQVQPAGPVPGFNPARGLQGNIGGGALQGGAMGGAGMLQPAAGGMFGQMQMPMPPMGMPMGGGAMGVNALQGSMPNLQPAANIWYGGMQGSSFNPQITQHGNYLQQGSAPSFSNPGQGIGRGFAEDASALNTLTRPAPQMGLQMGQPMNQRLNPQVQSYNPRMSIGF